MENYDTKDEYEDRTVYLKKDVIHRLDGPAIEWANGGCEYFINGVRHRVDGPALITSDGSYSYFINGVKYETIPILKDFKESKRLTLLKSSNEYLLKYNFDPSLLAYAAVNGNSKAISVLKWISFFKYSFCEDIDEAIRNSNNFSELDTISFNLEDFGQPPHRMEDIVKEIRHLLDK
jgi:hypothetical protein